MYIADYIYIHIYMYVYTHTHTHTHTHIGFPGGSVVKNPSAHRDTGHVDLVPGLERSPGEGNGNPLQYSCLENPMDGEAWWNTAHEVTKSWT